MIKRQLKPSVSEKRLIPGDAAQSYWQELFNSEQLSPPEYKYLFPELSNVENEAVKELLSYKLTAEMNLVVQADWSGLDAVGLTAFWLKVLSEPKIPQLRKCKLHFVTKIVEQLANSEQISLGLTDETNQDTSQKLNEPDISQEALDTSITEQPINTPDVSMMNTSINMQTTAQSDVTADGGLFSTNANPASVIEDDDPLLSIVENDTKEQVISAINSMLQPGGIVMSESESLLYQDDGKPLKPLEGVDDLDSSNHWIVTQNDSDTIFSCKSCHYSSPYKSRIKQHMRSVHSNIKPYKCDYCDHTTAIRASLTKHINAVHKKVKPFSCHLCSYTCNLKSSLEVHLSGFHQKVYRHNCPHCDYAAAAKNVVDIHIQAVHMKERPYKCPECDYSSAYPQYIPKHIAAVHERKKPYACPHCDYKSSYKTYLQKHCDAVHNNIKPYSCPHCSYVTSYSQYLTKHISAVHNDEKPHKCPLCDFRCAYKQYINKHIELVHAGAQLPVKHETEPTLDMNRQPPADNVTIGTPNASRMMTEKPTVNETAVYPNQLPIAWPGMDNMMLGGQDLPPISKSLPQPNAHLSSFPPISQFNHMSAANNIYANQAMHYGGMKTSHST